MTHFNVTLDKLCMPQTQEIQLFGLIDDKIVSV